MTEDKEAKKPQEDTKEVRKGRKRPIRVTRDLLVNRGPLQVPDSVKTAGMAYFWMKDGPYQFEKYNRLGYEFVMDKDGKKVFVGRTGETMYLLEIPEDLHEELKDMKSEIRKERTDERKGIQNPRKPQQSEGIFEERLVVK